MAATRRNAMVHEEARRKVKTTQLINRLQEHVLGSVEMTKTQVSAAGILLKKVLPDLQAVSLADQDGKPLSALAVIMVPAKA